MGTVKTVIAMTIIDFDKEERIISQCLSMLNSQGYPMAQVQRHLKNWTHIYVVQFWDGKLPGTVEITVDGLPELVPAVQGWLSKFGAKDVA